MIDISSLKKGDRFWQCYEYHWIVRLEFVAYDEFLNIIIAKYDEDFGIYKKGKRCEICTYDFKESFSTLNEAKIYQQGCRDEIKKLSKDELLKILFDKCYFLLTDEEQKLYEEIIYKKEME